MFNTFIIIQNHVLPWEISFKGELNDGTWLEKREQLMFASFQFEAVHHQLKTNTTDYDPGTTSDADDEGK